MRHETTDSRHEGADPAEAVGDVVDAAQLYLCECDPKTLAIILRRCMPYPIIDAEDVELYAHKLRKECSARKESGGIVPPALEAMQEFFARAAKVIYILREESELEQAVGTAITSRRRGPSPATRLAH